MYKYKNLLTSAVKIVLEHKYLWFFGFFAAFIANASAIKNIFGEDSADFAKSWQSIKDTGIFDLSIVNNLTTLAQEDLAGLLLRAAVLLTVFILGIFILWLAVVSQGALIRAVANIELNKKSDFKIALAGGISFFWPIFFFRFLERAVIFALMALVGFAASYTIAYAQNWPLRALAIVMFIVAIFLIFSAAVVVRYAMSFNIIRNDRFIDALKNSAALFRKNLFMSIEMGAVIFLINVALGFLVLMVISALAIPFILLMFVFYKLAFAAGLTFVLIMGTLLLFVAVALTGAVLSVFSDSLWTIFFINLLKESPVSRINSWLSVFTKKAAD